MALGTPLLTVLCVACYFLVFWASRGTHLQFFLPSVLSRIPIHRESGKPICKHTNFTTYLSLLLSLLLPRSLSPTPPSSPSFLPYCSLLLLIPSSQTETWAESYHHSARKNGSCHNVSICVGGGESSWGNPLCYVTLIVTVIMIFMIISHLVFA